MSGYFVKLEEETVKNENYRKVLFTAPHSQLVLMSLKPNEEIGEEVHELDQFIRIETGKAKAILDGEVFELSDGDAVVVPRGTKHNIINISDSELLKLYTVYSPAEHKPGTIQKEKPAE